MNDPSGKPDPAPQGEPDSERLVFHYSRERRLETAPESVQRAYRDGYTPNKGFIKGLTANAGLRSVFFVIIILCAIIGGIMFFGDQPGSVTVGDVSITLKAFLYEENVYVTIRCARKTLDAKVPVTVTFASLDAQGNVVGTKQVQGVLEEMELSLRSVMPDYETNSVKATIRLGERDAVVAIAVDRK